MKHRDLLDRQPIMSLAHLPVDGKNRRKPPHIVLLGNDLIIDDQISPRLKCAVCCIPISLLGG